MVCLSRSARGISALAILLGAVFITSCSQAERSEPTATPAALPTTEIATQPPPHTTRSPTVAPTLTQSAENAGGEAQLGPRNLELPECTPGGGIQPQTYYTITNLVWPDLLEWDSYRYHALYFYKTGDAYAKNELALEITSARANRMGSISDLDIQAYYQIPLIQQVYTGNHTQVRDLRTGAQSEYVITEEGAWLKPQVDEPWLALPSADPADLITSHDIYGPHFLVGLAYFAEESVMAATETINDQEVIHRCWDLDSPDDTVGYILHGIDLGMFFDSLEVHLWTSADDTRLVRIALQGKHAATRYFEEVDRHDPPQEFYYWIDVFDVNQPFVIEPPPESEIVYTLSGEGAQPASPLETTSEAFPNPADSQSVARELPTDADPFESVRPREHYFETFELADWVLTAHLGEGWYDMPAERQPVYETGLTLSEVLTFYGEEMKARGWELDRVVFQAASPRVFLVYTRDQVPALVLAESMKNGKTRLSLFKPPGEELIDILLQDWELFTEENSDLRSNRVTAIDFDTAGNVWVSSQQTGGWTLTASDGTTREIPVREGGISVFNGETWKPFDGENSGSDANSVWALAVDWRDHLWISESDQLIVLGGDHRHTFSAEEIGIEGVITQIQIENKSVWVSSEDGLSVYENSVWKPYKILYRVTAFDVDDDGTPWVGTNGGGLFSLENGEWVEHIFPGTAANVSSSSDIEALRVDSNGDLWVLSDTQGVRTFDGVTWRSFTAEETGIDIRYWSGMTLDQADRVWAVSFSGRLVMLDESWKWVDFTPLTTDISLYGPNTISADPQGRIWVGLDEGVAVFTPPAP